MLPTLEPENNHVAAVLAQQAGADQRQRFAHAGQCAPAERQLQAGGQAASTQAGREALALLLCDDQVADSHRALPSRASGEFEVVIMIAVVIEEMDGSD
jgi:hypothetical protein